MPFDPSIPQENTLADAAQMRAQLTGLRQLIDAVPTIASVVVDSVNTLPAGSQATVNAVITGSVLHLAFAIPQDAPLAGVNVNSVTTLNPGESATASVSFDGTELRFDFGIPRGPDGAPGEVTNSALDAGVNFAITTALSNSSASSNVVGLMDTPFTNDPPTLSDVEILRAKINELITALRR